MFTKYTEKLTRSIRVLCLLTSLTAAASLSASAATFTVTNTNDAGAGSLRQAILDSNNSPENDVIEFSSLFNTAQTIIMKSGLNVANANKGSLTINGPSMNQLTLKGMSFSTGLAIFTGATATINNFVITRSSISVYGGTFSLNNSSVTNCSGAGGIGGGLATWQGSQVTLTNSTLSDNFGGYVGGGIYNSDSTLTLINSTVSNNQSMQAGSGIYNIRGTVNLVNSTIAFNKGRNGVIDVHGGVHISGGTLNTRNSIINSLASDNPKSTLNSQGYNLIGRTNGVKVIGDTATNLLNVDLQLDPVLRNNGGVTLTHVPLASSPAIDAALAADGAFTDQRGMPRPIDISSKQNAAGSDSTDIGAVERQEVEVNN